MLLGLIEGITEFLPVSSTGHLLLAQNWLPKKTDDFNVIIQMGAMMAVLLVFSGRIRDLYHKRHESGERGQLKMLAIAFVFTCFGGLLLELRGWKLSHDIGPVAWATLVGGIVILGVERRRAKQTKDAPTHRVWAGVWPVALAAAAAQILAATVPGTSRSGAVIIVLLLCGAGRTAAVEFSFLLGLPTILAAGGYKLLKLLRAGTMTEPPEMLLLGTVVAAAAAFATARWLLKFVQGHDLRLFGWYRIALGGGLLAMMAWSGGGKG